MNKTIINCHGQQFHPDARIYLTAAQKHYLTVYTPGKTPQSVRIIDALSFVRLFPTCFVGDSFVIGTHIADPVELPADYQYKLSLQAVETHNAWADSV